MGQYETVWVLRFKVPFAGEIEAIRRILDVVAPVDFLIGRARVERQGGHMGGLVDADDGHPKIGPGQQSDHLGVAARPLRFDIVAAVMQADGLVGGAGAVDAIEAEVGRASALGAAPADEQLAEVGFAGVGGPDRAGAFLPTRDDPPAADRRPRSGRSFPNGVGVLGRQDQRFLQEVDAVADLNGDGSAGPRAPLGASGVARLGESSDRAVRRNNDCLRTQSRYGEKARAPAVS